MKYLKIITTISILLTLATLNTKAQAVMFEYDAAGNMIKRMADVVCFQDLTISSNRNNTQLQRLYTSSGTIDTQSFPTVAGADVIVRENELVEIRADHITLEPGFKVESEGCFSAAIDPCEQ